MRKAIQGHMRAHGFRVTRGQGGHVKTGAYARAAMDELGIDSELMEFDTIRQLRNQSEYEALFVQPDEVEDALASAHAIVDAVAHALGVERS
jgi:hypothetical protein